MLVAKWGMWNFNRSSRWSRQHEAVLSAGQGIQKHFTVFYYSVFNERTVQRADMPEVPTNSRSLQYMVRSATTAKTSCGQQRKEAYRKRPFLSVSTGVQSTL